MMKKRESKDWAAGRSANLPLLVLGFMLVLAGPQMHTLGLNAHVGSALAGFAMAVGIVVMLYGAGVIRREDNAQPEE